MSRSGSAIKPRWDLPSGHNGDFPPDWGARRRSVYKRDDWTCTKCGRQSGPYAGDDGVRLHAHHVVPRSEGGSNRLSNLTTLCEPCHADLHGHDLFETVGTNQRFIDAPLIPQLLAYLVLVLLGSIGGGLVYLWAVAQLLTLSPIDGLSITWQTLLAIGVLLTIAVVGYYFPKLVVASSLGAGLLFGGLLYYIIGHPLVNSGIMMGVFWLPAGIVGVLGLLRPWIRSRVAQT